MVMVRKLGELTNARKLYESLKEVELEEEPEFEDVNTFEKFKDHYIKTSEEIREELTRVYENIAKERGGDYTETMKHFESFIIEECDEIVTELYDKFIIFKKMEVLESTPNLWMRLKNLRKASLEAEIKAEDEYADFVLSTLSEGIKTIPPDYPITL